MVTTAINLKPPGILSLLFNTVSTIKFFSQATGYFVTHGGFNGVTESLGSGVPLYGFPSDL